MLQLSINVASSISVWPEHPAQARVPGVLHLPLLQQCQHILVECHGLNARPYHGDVSAGLLSTWNADRYGGRLPKSIQMYDK
jgi:hypothetical protein